MQSTYLILTAVVIDLVVGDPRFITHPVVIMGRVINLLENYLRRIFKGEAGERIGGAILTLTLVVGTYFITYYLIYLAYRVNSYLGLALNLWLLSTTLALKGLVQEGRKIYSALVDGDLELARRRLNWIVGRDTEGLDESEIVRGTIETLAENTSDGIIAPLFCGLLGGAPLAMAYKAVNTLDSMVGYKNDRYLYFGWASARIDDLVNLIPARLTGLLLVGGALLRRKDWKGATKVVLRDAKKHPSPNAGFPESVVAGALEIRLGGVNYYEGEKSFRAYLGDKKKEFDKSQIKETIYLIYLAVFILLFLVAMVR